MAVYFCDIDIEGGRKVQAKEPEIMIGYGIFIQEDYAEKLE